MSKLDEVADQPILEGTADIYLATGACVGLAIALHGALCELHNLGHEELFEKIRNAAKIDAAKSTTEGNSDFNGKRATEASLQAIDRAIDRTRAAIQRGKSS